ncbi:MAG: malectin domain-containing carbohydrate-binding protein [Isosphaeraceae bacterium]|nr:malectin domain-containing carbohydrate-binding protein [Isosphaeraceae bacterium]
MTRQTSTEGRRARLARRIDALDGLEPRSMITESFGLMIMGLGLHASAQAATAHPSAERDATRPSKTERPTPTAGVVPIRAGRSARGTGGNSGPGPHTRETTSPPSRTAKESDWITLLRPKSQAPESSLHHGREPIKGKTNQGGAAASRNRSSGQGAITPLRLAPPKPSSSSNGATNPGVLVGSLLPLGRGSSTASGLINNAPASNAPPTVTRPSLAQPDSSPTVTVVATTPSASDLGPVPGVFTFTRTGATSAPLVVNYVLSGTGIWGSDYLLSPSSPLVNGAAGICRTITIPAGSASTTLTVNPVINTLDDGTPTVEANLNFPFASFGDSFTIGSPSSATVTITNPNASATASAQPYFPLYTLDVINGVTLNPNATQLATLGGNGDLLAQVGGDSISSFSWNTSNLTHATSITGTSTSELKFQWDSTNSAPAYDSATLTVTDTSAHQESVTYYFFVPAGTGSGGGSTGYSVSTDNAIDPQALPGTPTVASQNAAVSSLSGSLDTTLTLPAYSPNIAPVALTYDSLTADPRPIIEFTEQVGSGMTAVGETISSFDGNSAINASNLYNTSNLITGDVVLSALQVNASSLPTGVYTYNSSVQYQISSWPGSTWTTGWASPTAALDNESSNPIGSGWTVSGLERIYSASGGVLLTLGSQGGLLSFSGPASGGAFTAPAGDFSTLVQNSGGSYTRTLKDGTQINFNSAGYETASVDRNGLHTTYSYNSGGALTSIEDPYGRFTTFSYNGSGLLQSITDPAGRVATFTHAGSNLSGVTLPDSSSWGYSYSSTGEMTSIVDPRSKAVTIAYDSADRVGTIARPDGTSQEFSSYEEQGWYPSGTGTTTTPASATLLAQAAATYTDPRGNATYQGFDWLGHGVNNELTQNNIVSIANVNANGLTIATSNQIGWIVRSTYDSKGNLLTSTNPLGQTDAYTYNSFSEVTTHTDPDGNTTTYTYDSHGNETGVQDPLGNRTTMTYTTDGKLATSQDARGNVASYSYDSQDRLTTIAYPDGTTKVTAYDNQGDVASVTDGRGFATTYSYDAMDRVTGTTAGVTTTPVLAINAGGSAAGSFLADTDFSSGSNTYSTTNTIDTSGVTNPAPQAVYQTERWSGGTFTYTLPGLAPGGAYSVRLDFAENYFTGSGQREFNVTINGTQVLTNFDIFATAGAANKAVAETFSAAADSSGDITIAFTNVTGGSKVDGVEITPVTGQRTTYTYDAAGNQTSAQQPLSRTTSYAYDAMDRLTTTTDALGHTTVFGYDGNGNKITVTDPLGRTTTTAYDSLDRPISVTDPTGAVTTSAYDLLSDVAGTTDAEGNQATYTYDPQGQLTAVSKANGTTVTAYGYDAAGNQVTVSDYVGHVQTTHYDQDNRPVTVTDPTGATTTTTYDAVGNARTTTNADGATTTNTYDSRNRLIATTDALGHTTSYTYDASGNQATVTDALGHTTTTVYDFLNRATTVTDPVGNVTVTGFDAAGRKAFEVDPAGNRTTYAYDAADRLTTITSPLGTTTTYVYDAAGEVVDQTDGDGRRTTFSYDGDGHQTGETWLTSSGGVLQTTTTSYNAVGQMTSIANPQTDLTFAYDPFGNVAQVDNNSWTTVATASSSTSALVDGGLQPGTAYSYRVAAVTSSGTYSTFTPVATAPTNSTSADQTLSDNFDTLSNASSQGSNVSWLWSNGYSTQNGVISQAVGWYGMYDAIAGSGYSDGDQEVVAKVRVDSWSAGDSAQVGIGLHVDQSAGTGYELTFSDSGGSNKVELLNNQSGGGQNLGASASFAWNVGQWYWFDIRIQGSTLSGKVWADGSDEPSSWTVTQTVGGSFGTAASGQPALYSGTMSSSGSAAASFDDLSATDTLTSSYSLVATPTPQPGQVRLTWAPITGATGYLVERSPNGSTGWTQIASAPSTALDLVDSDLSANSTYYYRVRATLSSGYSSYTSIANATTSAQAIPSLQFNDNFDSGTIGSSWSFVNGSWSESGGVLSQTAADSSDPRKAIVDTSGAYATGDQEILAKVRVDSWTNGDAARAGVGLYTNASTGAGYNLVFHYTSGSADYLQFLNDGVAWGTAVAFTWTPGTWYWFRMELQGSTLYGKVWADGTDEPSAWTITQSVGGSFGSLSGGYPSLNGGTGLWGGNATDSFDDVQVGTPTNLNPSLAMTAASDGAGQIRLSWAPISGATSYIIQRTTTPANEQPETVISSTYDFVASGEFWTGGGSFVAYLGDDLGQYLGQTRLVHTNAWMPDSTNGTGAGNSDIYDSYDQAGRLATEWQSGTAGFDNEITVTYAYDPAGLMTAENRYILNAETGTTTGATISTSFTYDAAERLTSMTHQVVGGSSLDSELYGYDAANRLIGETNAEGAVSYTYDAADELTGVSGARSESYSYSSGGNRSGTGYTTGTDNEQTAGAGYTYAYDGVGNMTSETQTSTGNVTTFSYDYHNELTGETQRNSGGTVLSQATYTYDALGRRIATNVNGVQTWTVYNGSTPYADFDASGNLEHTYLYGQTAGAPAARTDASGNTNWYLTDRLGSVRDVVNTSGTVVDHLAYDSFGNVTSESSPSNGDRFKFAGMQFDSASGQYYDAARYYDEAIGRFMEQDPSGFSGGSANLYEYVDDDPTNAIDLTGLVPARIQRLVNNSGNRAAASAAWAATAAFANNLIINNRNSEQAHSAATGWGNVQSVIELGDKAKTGYDAYDEIVEPLINEGLDAAFGGVGGFVVGVVKDEIIVKGVGAVIDNIIKTQDANAAKYRALADHDYQEFIANLAKFDSITRASITVNDVRRALGMPARADGNIE